MNKDYQSILINENNEMKNGVYGNSFFMSGMLIFINLVLMTGIGIYWTNTNVHEYLSGRPL